MHDCTNNSSHSKKLESIKIKLNSNSNSNNSSIIKGNILCIDRKNDLVLAGTENGEVFFNDLRMVTNSNQKNTTNNDNQKNNNNNMIVSLSSNINNNNNNEIGACLFDNDSNNNNNNDYRYIYFARGPSLEKHDMRKISSSSSSSSSSKTASTTSKIKQRTFLDDISALAIDQKQERMAIADDSGDVTVISLLVLDTTKKKNEDDTEDINAKEKEEFDLVQIFKNAHGTETSGCATAVSFRGHKPEEVISAGYDLTVKKWDINRKNKEVSAWKIKEVQSARTEIDNKNKKNYNVLDMAFNPPYINSMKCWDERWAVHENGMKRLCVVARGDGVVSVLDLDRKDIPSSSQQKKKGNKNNVNNGAGGQTPLRNFSAIHLGEAMNDDGSRFGHTHTCSYAEFLPRYFGNKIISGGLDGKIILWDWTLELDESARKVLNTGGVLETIEHKRKVNTLKASTLDDIIVVADTSTYISAYVLD